jgi:uncharacterized protein (TIGR02246 family)
MQIQPVGAETVHGEDIIAIQDVIARLQDAQQGEDPEGFLALFQEDAVWVTAHGRRLTGLSEISDFTHRVLPGAMQESTATYEVVHVLFVRPDVAVVNVRQQPVSLDGQLLPTEPQGSPVYVMARNGGRWEIAAGQNTQVRPA